jgi:glucose/mannose transport system permease protein
MSAVAAPTAPAPTAVRPGVHRRRRVVRVIVLYALMVLLAVFYLLPVYVLLMTALKTFGELQVTSPLQPPPLPTLANFGDAFGRMAASFANSFELVIPATVLSSLLGSLNGYVLSKWRFRGSNTLFTLLLFGMFIPYQAVLIPLTQVLSTIGLYGTIPGLILVHVVYGIPICTLIFRNYYAAVPGELIEASRIDGASVFGVYRHVMLPLSMPGFVVVVIWQFTSIWNEFLFALTLVNNPGAQPVTVALQNMTGSVLSQYQLQMAGAILTALPPLVLYIFLGRYFVRGLLAGSLKG